MIVTNRDEYEAAIRTAEFTAILSAYRIPEWNGIEALHLLRESGRNTPFLLVTGTLGEDAAVECMKQGVNDYVRKDRLTLLPLALERAVQQKHLRDAHARVSQALTESEARNRELVQNSVYGIFRVSPDGKFHSANPSLLQMLACSSLDDLQPFNVASDVFRYPAEFATLISACRERGLVHSAESEWRRKDGGLISVRIHLRFLSVPALGEVLEGIVEDITEVRALEHQLQQAQKFENDRATRRGHRSRFQQCGWSDSGLGRNWL